MLTDQVVSISDLRAEASKHILSLSKKGDKYIFIHNKPKAVLVDIDRYEKLIKFAKNNRTSKTVTDKEVVGSINKVFGWDEKDLIFG